MLRAVLANNKIATMPSTQQANETKFFRFLSLSRAQKKKPTIGIINTMGIINTYLKNAPFTSVAPI